MKFDMHTHTKVGSLDARATIPQLASVLMQNGFDGMLITDHNSYKGYDQFQSQRSRHPELCRFVVLRGIEYDTCDAGHMLIIMPDDCDVPILEIRGMSVLPLIRIVHQLGGIIGPAHPFGNGSMAIMNSRIIRRHRSLLKEFDFIEVFNSTLSASSNLRARLLNNILNLVPFAGSDAHSQRNAGTAYTEFSSDIFCNNDLIRAVKEKSGITAAGDQERCLRRYKPAFVRMLGISMYWLYNQSTALYRYPSRRRFFHHFII